MTDKIKVVRLGSALVCGTWGGLLFLNTNNYFILPQIAGEHGFFLWTRISRISLFLAHGWIFSLNTNRSNSTNVFGIRMDFFFEHEFLECHECFWHTDGHGFYHAEDYILTSGFRRIVSRMERLLPFGQWVFDKSRVQRKIHPLSIRVLSGILFNSADE